MPREDWERRVEWLRRILSATYLPEPRRDQLQNDLDWLLFVDSLGLVTN